MVECVEIEGSELEEEVDKMVRESLSKVDLMFKQKLNPRVLAPGGQGCEVRVQRPRAEVRTSRSVVLEWVSQVGSWQEMRSKQ